MAGLCCHYPSNKCAKDRLLAMPGWQFGFLLKGCHGVEETQRCPDTPRDTDWRQANRTSSWSQQQMRPFNCSSNTRINWNCQTANYHAINCCQFWVTITTSHFSDEYWFTSSLMRTNSAGISKQLHSPKPGRRRLIIKQAASSLVSLLSNRWKTSHSRIFRDFFDTSRLT